MSGQYVNDGICPGESNTWLVNVRCGHQLSGKSLGMYVKAPLQCLGDAMHLQVKLWIDQGGASFFYPISVALWEGKK